MSFTSLILDTETHSLNGLPIEIAYVPCQVNDQAFSVQEDLIYDEYFSLEEGTEIHYASMAVHHIIPEDLADKPLYTTFRLPQNTIYLIGHNIDYDIEALARCGQDTTHIKGICTLALARDIWLGLDSYNLSALSYYLSDNLAHTRQMLRSAHNAKTDVLITAELVQHIIHQLNIDSIEALYEASQAARLPKYMPYGKHKGLELIDLPADYVRWLLKQDNVNIYLRQALEAIFSK